MIIVDSREPNELADKINQSIPAEVSQLEYGDFAFSGIDVNSMGLERKTDTDLDSSLQNGRLDTQLRGCLEYYNEVALLLQIVSQFPPGKWLAPFFRTLYRNGIDVYICGSGAREVADVVVALYNHANNPNHKLLNRYLRYRPQLWKPNTTVEALLSMAFCQDVRLQVNVAEEMVRRWKTIHEIFKHSDEWNDIQGMGSVTRKKLLNAYYGGKE